MNKRLLAILVLMSSLLVFRVNAQSLYQPYSYDFYQKFSDILYNQGSREHTAIKPFIIDSALQSRYDSLMNLGVKERKTWLGNVVWNQHLLQTEEQDFTLYADFLPDFQIGKSGRTLWLNTRGFQAGGTIGKKFSFYTNFFENQSVFPEYVQDYILENKVIPGQQGKQYDYEGGNQMDWSYASAVVSFTPSKYINIALAYDKNFIGDGYRSLLLSDFSSNYTALKLTGTIGNVRYMSMWAYMLDPFASNNLTAEDSARIGTGDRWKWGAFQYLDWNVNNRLSVGLFQSVLWASKNAAGTRGFDPSYLNPIIFLRPIESANTSSPDKVHLGATAKYKLFSNLSLYGQFLLGEFTASELFSSSGYLHNKYAVQLGFRGFDAFHLKNLNYLVEYNAARPYTYQHFTPITAYTNYNQPLAHPYGANFREFVTLWNYRYQRFDFALKGIFAVRGLDPSNDVNYGGNPFKSYENYVHGYGNYIGQGLRTNLGYAEAKVSYLFNPKYNLRLELGGTFRQEKNDEWNDKTLMINFGLRSSFRNLYYDF